MSNPLPPGATGTDQTFAPALLGTFRDGVSVLEQGIQQIKDAWNGLINAVNGFIQRVNDYLDDRHFWQQPFDWLFDGLQEGCEKLKAVISQVQEKVNSVLDVADPTSQVSDVVATLTAVGADVAEVAATDVAGALQASNHASEGTGQAVALILNYLASLASRLAGVVAQINELANEYGDHTGLPQGQWPQAVNA